VTVAAERYRRKADIAVAAWASLFGAPPTRNALVRAMSVAEFETHLGDAGFRNWGGVQKRGLRADEVALLAAHGLSAGTDGALTAARELLAPGSNEILAQDSSPATGPYFTWFWAFDSDVDAAKKFLQVLVKDRPAVRAVIDHASVDELARAMYATRYFEGFHRNDPEANIRDYARNIGATGKAIEDALGRVEVETPQHQPALAVGFLVAAIGLAVARGPR
jgi:hypothetical protein